MASSLYVFPNSIILEIRSTKVLNSVSSPFTEGRIPASNLVPYLYEKLLLSRRAKQLEKEKKFDALEMAYTCPKPGVLLRLTGHHFSLFKFFSLFVYVTI